jgi:hypothetical protein
MNKNNFTDKVVGLVGNASLLLQKDYSKHIDNNDIVCRINRGIPTHSTQGKKFNFLFCSGHGKLINDILDKIPDNVKIIYANEINNDLKLDLQKKLNIKNKKQKPSTGLLALAYIINKNPKCINLYGFDWKKSKTYYEEEYYKKNSIIWNAHDFNEEEKLVKEYYSKKYDIRIFE